MQIAKTILEQLGGNKFRVMTGAKDFIGGDDFLMFKIGGGAKKRINKIKITLLPSDTYKMEFYNIRKMEVKTIALHEGVYCDQLQEIFTQETGFHTKLF